MEQILDLLIDIFLEPAIQASTDKNKSKLTRSFFILYILFVILFVFGVFAFIGIKMIKTNLLILGIFFILLGATLFILSMKNFKDVYFQRKQKEELV